MASSSIDISYALAKGEDIPSPLAPTNSSYRSEKYKL
jgi:hypothetical protein